MRIFLASVLMFLLIAPKGSQGCSILFHKLIVKQSNTESKAATISDVIAESDCNTKTQERALKVLEGFNTNVSTKYLQSAFPNELANVTALTPDEVSVVPVENLLSSNLNIPKDAIFKNTTVLGKNRLFSISSNSSFVLKCHECTNGGTKEISLSTDINGERNTIWINTKLLLKTKALIATDNLNVTKSNLSKDDVVSQTIFTEHPEDYFNNAETISFYKLGRSIPANAPLISRELIPVAIVKPNIAARLKFKSSNLLLSGSAMPQKTGTIGETIPLRNMKTNKIIYGTVTGYNEVEILL